MRDVKVICDAIALRRHDVIRKEYPNIDRAVYDGIIFEHALRFGNADCLRTLMDCGANFRLNGYYDSPRLVKLIKRAPWMSTPYCVTYDWYRCDILDHRVIEMTPKSERLASLRLLLDRYEPVDGKPPIADSLLFSAIISQDREFVELLRSYGVTFSKNARDQLFNTGAKNSSKGFRGAFCDILDKTECMYMEKFLDIAQDLLSECPDLKIPITNLFIEENDDDLFKTPDILNRAVDCFDFKNIKRKQLIEKHFRVEFFPAYEKLGWLNIKANRDSIIQQASERNNTEITAYVLDFINRNVDTELERRKEESRQRREMNASPDSTSMLAKTYGFRAYEDGIALTGIRRPITDIIIPSRIGTRPMIRIQPYALSRKKTKMDPQNVRSIAFPEGLTSIGESAAEALPNLERITLPSTLKTIGRFAFSNCGKLSNVILNEGLEEIGEYAFKNCEIDEIVIPASVRNTIFELVFDYPKTKLIVHRDSYAHGYCVTQHLKHEVID